MTKVFDHRVFVRFRALMLTAPTSSWDQLTPDLRLNHIERWARTPSNKPELQTLSGGGLSSNPDVQSKRLHPASTRLSGWWTLTSRECCWSVPVNQRAESRILAAKWGH